MLRGAGRIDGGIIQSNYSCLFFTERLYQHLAEIFDILCTADFFGKKRHPHDMEIFIKIVNLLEVLLLHLVSHIAVLAVRSYIAMSA